jgi:preprotein translocase subunit SecB
VLMTTPLSRQRQPMPSMNVKEIRLESVFFQVNPQYKEKAGQEGFAYGLRIDTHLSKEGSSLLVQLGVETPETENNPDYPFYFNLKFVGVFDFSALIDENSRRQIASINCPAIIYPYLRETLADLTRRAGFPPLHLPVTNFQKLAKSEGSPTQESASQTPKSPNKSSREPTRQRKKRSAKPE